MNPTRDLKLSLDDVQRLVAPAFPQKTVDGFEELSGGLCNTNLKVSFTDRQTPVVLRLYQREPPPIEKEIEVLQLVSETVPVPQVFYAGFDDFCTRSFAVLEFVSGITFQQLKAIKDVRAIQQASYSVGKILAAIGQYTFPTSGPFLSGLKVGAPYFGGVDAVPRILDEFLLSQEFQKRTNAELRTRLHNFIWSWSDRLANLNDECQLVHSDFGGRNILVREIESSWLVVAVLDWEFAFSGSSLLDVGHFLRYEKHSRPLREPYFSRGFTEHGGKLPDNWRRLGRVIDLTGLCDVLSHSHLPDEVASEVLELIHDTLEDPDLY